MSSSEFSRSPESPFAQTRSCCGMKSRRTRTGSPLIYILWWHNDDIRKKNSMVSICEYLYPTNGHEGMYGLQRKGSLELIAKALASGYQNFTLYFFYISRVTLTRSWLLECASMPCLFRMICFFQGDVTSAICHIRPSHDLNLESRIL